MRLQLHPRHVLDSFERYSSASSQASLLAHLFSEQSLSAVFEHTIRPRGGRGIDRIGVDVFAERVETEVALVARKALEGTYHFAPYQEQLLSKGRDRLPRVISIPTLRDRIVLHQLKSFLHAVLPECVTRKLPNEYIRILKAATDALPLEESTFLRGDIESFFDTIDHQLLLSLLRARVRSPAALSILRRAIRNPTVSGNSHRPRGIALTNRRGVPQGLAVSNVLADAYLQEVDAHLRVDALLYLRYVDDILLLWSSGDATSRKAGVDNHLARFGLRLSPTKTQADSCQRAFEYLGYHVQLPEVSVKRSTAENFLRGIAALIAEYRHRLRGGKHPKWLPPELRRRVLVEELNERITGAISETRRYGWLFYFSEITDLSLLYRLDATIEGLFARLPDFEGKAPPGLKRLVRAYYETKYSPTRGYIHNYNEYQTVAEKARFLVRRGVVPLEQTEHMTEREIDAYFEREKQRRLHALEEDVGRLY